MQTYKVIATLAICAIPVAFVLFVYGHELAAIAALVVTGTGFLACMLIILWSL